MSLLLLCAFFHILRSSGLQYGLWTSEEKLWTIYWVNSKLMSPFNPPASSFLPRSWLVINKREAPAGPLRQVRFHGQLLKALLSWTRCCRVWKGSKLKTGWSECEIQLQTSQDFLHYAWGHAFVERPPLSASRIVDFKERMTQQLG